MPQPFNPAVMTADGEALLAKAAIGQCKVEYVCMAVGSGIYSDAEKTTEALKERRALKLKKNEYAFSNVQLENKNCVLLTSLITNQDPVTMQTLVSDGYYINEIGIYAKEQGAENSTAILYSIAVTAGTNGNGDFMPPYNGYNRAEITQNYFITVNNSSEIVVQMKGAAFLAEDALILIDTELIEDAFYTTFTKIEGGSTDESALTKDDIYTAVNTEWNGESSSDETAMTAENVNEAINTEWNGESSSDETALSAEDVKQATNT